MSIAIVKKEEMAPQYDANGFSRMEMLPGTFPGAHNYKCFLKAGHDVQPEKYADKTAVYLSLIHISEPTRPGTVSRMPSSA